MDVLYFLKERTQFIRAYYETAGEPFRKIIRKIEAGEHPFAPDPFFVPNGSEDEPLFLEEWSQAKTSLEILGRQCVSMLSESLKLYFQTWESELPIKWNEEQKRRYFKNGFVGGYQRCFGEILNVTWQDCPVDFDLLEQITLVRNDEQHPDSITTMHLQHKPKTRAKFPSPFFISDDEKVMFSASNIPISSWFQPSVHVSREKLLAAIDQVESLGDWLEDRMFAAKYPQKAAAHG